MFWSNSKLRTSLHMETDDIRNINYKHYNNMNYIYIIWIILLGITYWAIENSYSIILKDNALHNIWYIKTIYVTS